MLTARGIFQQIHRDDRAFRLFCSIAMNGESQGGWENGRIIALRKPTWSGDAPGWMVIDVQRHAVSGPITDEERRREPELRAIATMSPAAAWSKLRW